MQPTSAGDLLREARLRHGVSQEALAIRAGTDRTVVSAIESGVLSPKASVLGELFELLGEELLLGVERRLTGIDLTLNSGNLELTPDQRVAKGLAFADLVRDNRPRGAADLGRPLRPAPMFRALICRGVDFVVIGSIAGLVHGSAYPTYDLDLACKDDSENLECLNSALGQLGIELARGPLPQEPVLACETDFGSLDIVWEVPGIESYEQLRRDTAVECLSDFRVKVASLDHLIAMKRASGKRKDRLMLMEYVELADEIRRREAKEGG